MMMICHPAWFFLVPLHGEFLFYLLLLRQRGTISLRNASGNDIVMVAALLFNRGLNEWRKVESNTLSVSS